MKHRNRDATRPNLPSRIQNPVSLGGLILAAWAFFTVGCLFAIDILWGFQNLYLGILNYISALGFLITGMHLVAIVVLREQYCRCKGGPGELGALTLPKPWRGFVTSRRNGFACSPEGWNA